MGLSGTWAGEIGRQRRGWLRHRIEPNRGLIASEFSMQRACAALPLVLGQELRHK